MVVRPAHHAATLPLPAELLIYIFGLATYSPARELEALVELPPFESIYARCIESRCDAALRLKHAIAMTSKAFRQLCPEFLYEDIRVRYGAACLADLMENSRQEDGAGIGQFVKRAVLSPVSSEGSSFYSNLRRIIRCCPNLEVLYRTRDVDPFPLDSSQGAEIYDCMDGDFPSLRRVDWLNCPMDALPVVSQFSPSFWTISSLTTLSVGADQWRSWHESDQTDDDAVSLCINTHTLRICSLDAFGPGQRLFIVDLPQLRRLILDKPEAMYALFGIAQFGAHITTLELGLHSEFARYDYLAVLIVYCQNATDLFFPVFTTQPTRKNDPRMIFEYQVKHVGLNAARLPDLNAEAGETEATELWQLLHSHFDSLCGEQTRFTKLEKITLYGREWDTYLDDARFEACASLVCARDVALVREDGTKVPSSYQTALP